MSTETVKGGVSSSLDTSHLKVPFPFKKKIWKLYWREVC